MRAEKRPHEWLGGVLGVLGLALSARTSQIHQKVLKEYFHNVENHKVHKKNTVNHLITKRISELVKM